MRRSASPARARPRDVRRGDGRAAGTARGESSPPAAPGSTNVSSLEREPGSRLDPTEGIWARVAAEGQGIRVTTASAADRLRQYLLAESIRNLMAAPVRGGSGVVAVLTVMNREGNVGGWRDEDLTLLETLANHAGIALRNGELVEGLASRAAENEYQAHHDALTGLPNRAQFQVLRRSAPEGRGSRPSRC